MLSHRFQQQMQETVLPAQPMAGGLAFMPIPMVQGNDWMQSLYQLALAEAQKDAQAERRARQLAASMN